MRPRGEISCALQEAARQGPGTVAEICHRAQVGMSAGRYTASRMVDRGDLVVLNDGRPAVLVAADVAAAWRPAEHAASVNDCLQVLERSFWERPE